MPPERARKRLGGGLTELMIIPKLNASNRILNQSGRTVIWMGSVFDRSFFFDGDTNELVSGGYIEPTGFSHGSGAFPNGGPYPSATRRTYRIMKRDTESLKKILAHPGLPRDDKQEIQKEIGGI